MVGDFAVCLGQLGGRYGGILCHRLWVLVAHKRARKEGLGIWGNLFISSSSSSSSIIVAVTVNTAVKRVFEVMGDKVARFE